MAIILPFIVKLFFSFLQCKRNLFLLYASKCNAWKYPSFSLIIFEKLHCSLLADLCQGRFFFWSF